MRDRLIRFLSVLPTPLLILGSAHELYLRNQQELEGVVRCVAGCRRAGIRRPEVACLSGMGPVLAMAIRRPRAARALSPPHEPFRQRRPVSRPRARLLQSRRDSWGSSRR
mgnify:CR=1 FL=1